MSILQKQSESLGGGATETENWLALTRAASRLIGMLKQMSMVLVERAGIHVADRATVQKNELEENPCTVVAQHTIYHTSRPKLAKRTGA